MYEDLGDWHVENRLLEQGWEAGRPFRRQIQVKDDGSQTIWLDQIWEKHLVEEMLSFDEAIGSRIYEMSKDFIVEIKGQENNYRLR